MPTNGKADMLPAPVHTHFITLSLPGYPLPDARAEFAAREIKRGVFRTASGTLYTARQCIAIREA